MQSEGGTLDLLLHTHFPDSGILEEKLASIFVGRTTRLNWQVAAKVVTYRTVVWAKVFCPLQKSRNEWDISCPSARGMEGPHPLPAQNFSHLPGYWLCSNNMVPG
jgi:hypothetical protein